MDIMYDKSDVVNHTRVISADVNWVSVGSSATSYSANH